MKKNRMRALVDVIVFIAAFSLPWWVVLAAVSFCLFIFEDYYEIFFVGLILDSLYGVKLPWLSIPFMYFLIVTTLFIVINVLKRRLKFYF